MSLLRFLLQASRRVVLVSALMGILCGASGVGLIALVHAALGREGPPPAAIGIAFAALCLVATFTHAATQALMVRLAQNTVHELCLRICRNVLALPLQQFERLDSGGLTAALTEDIVLVASAMMGLPLVCINLPIVIVCFAFVGWLSLPVLTCALLFSVPAIAGYQWLGARALGQIKVARSAQDGLVGHFRSLLDGFRELKLHRRKRQAFLADAVEASATVVRDRTIQGLTFFAIAGGWSQLAFFGFLGLVVFVLPVFQPLSRQVVSGTVLVALYLLSPLDVILTWLPVLGRARVSLDKIQAFIPALERSAAAVADPDPSRPMALRDSIELRAASYAYDREPDGSGFALGPIDLALHRGEIVMLAGGNGSGKTTLVKVLTGLYAPGDGLILVDGKPVGPDDLEGYRQLFSVVFADGYLFPTLHGLEPGPRDGQARQWLSRLELDRIVRIDGGSFSTTQLSQGQRRRLALLAACLEDRPVYIFDEWAAHQDAHFKRVFYLELLPELRDRGKALLVISHDEEYFHVAGRVIKLHEGQVSEEAQTAMTEGRA